MRTTKFSRNEDVEMGKREDQVELIRNDHIRKEAHVKPVETFLENKILKWFGHCLRREPNHMCAKSLKLEVSRRSRGPDIICPEVAMYRVGHVPKRPAPLAIRPWQSDWRHSCI